MRRPKKKQTRKRKGPKGQLRIDPKEAKKHGLRPPEEADQRTLSPNEAARVLGITGEAVKRWIYDRHLPATKLPNGYWRIANTDLEAFIRRRTEGPRQRLLLFAPDSTERETLAGILVSLDLELIITGNHVDALLKTRNLHPNAFVVTLDNAGWRLIAEVRRAAHVRHAPILLLSQSDLSPEDTEHAMELKTQGFLRLPADDKTILKQVQHLLNGRA